MELRLNPVNAVLTGPLRFAGQQCFVRLATMLLEPEPPADPHAQQRLWISAMAEGDELALGQLYDSTLGKVYGLALRITGKPDMAHVSTSHVESHNQKMRAHMRRFTRLTAGHSKKFANHCHALAIYFAFYNFVKVHGSKRMSPAMAAGIETRLWEMKDLVAYIDARAPKPGRRGPYQKQEISN